MPYSPAPSCPRTRLVRLKASDGHVYWADPCSRGRLVSLRHFRKHVDREAFAALWRQVDRQFPSDLRCPVCARPMCVVFAPQRPRAMEIDVCPRCQLLWFDAGELRHYGDSAGQRERFWQAKESGYRDTGEPLPAAADAEKWREYYRRREFALKERARLWERERQGEDFGVLSAPPEAWQWVPALMGMPVEHRRAALLNLPLVTWITALVVLGVASASFGDMPAQLARFAFVPSDPWRAGGITLVTSFFLHGGWAHLLGNLYFLLVFGDDSEDYLGHGNFLLLLLAATIGGNLAVAHFTPTSSVAHIGASGGIFGVLTFYVLRFPRARLSYLVLFRFLRMPAWSMGLWMLALQVAGAYAQVGGLTRVSFLSHLGGALAGAVFYLLFCAPRGRGKPAGR